MFKKTLILGILIGALFTAQVALGANVDVTVGNGSGKPGDTNIEIPISVSDVTGLGIISADLQLNYDSSSLAFSSLTTSGTIAQSWGAPIYNSGTPGQLKVSLFGTAPLSGQGTLLKIYFNVNVQASGGTSTLSLVKAKFNDGKTITSTLQNGTFTVIAQNWPPVLDAIGNKQVNEGSSLIFNVTASDPDGDNLTYTASNLPKNASFNQTTHAFSFTPDYTQAGTYSGIHFEVSDDKGGTDSEDITITVNNVLRTYTLTIDATNGSVTKNPDQATYNEGTPVTLNATAATGYHFTGWSGDASGTTNPITITMDKDKSVTANFSINSYSLIVNKGSGSGTYNHGTAVSIKADSPEAGYKFTNWTGDVANVADVNASSTTITMLNNAVITANFEIITLINVTIGSGSGRPGDTNISVPITISSLGTKRVSAIDLTVNYNSGQLEATGAQKGALTQQWGLTANTTIPGEIRIALYHTVDLASSGGEIAKLIFNVKSAASQGANPLDLTVAKLNGVSADSLVDGSFTVLAPLTYNLTINKVGQGQTTPAEGTYTYNSGTPVTLTAVAATGYHFNNWSGDASGTTNPITITMDKDKSVTANFSINSYSLIVNKGSGSGTYNHGTAVSIKADSPEAGYKFTNWTGDVANVADVNASSTTITMLNNAVITANFEIITLINVTIGSGSGRPGDTKISVPVTISSLGTKKVSAIDLTLNYNSGQLEAIEVQKGALTQQWGLTVNTTIPGEIKIALYHTVDLASSGGEIAKLIFNVKPTASQGANPLDLTVAKLNGVSADSLVDGSFTVLAPLTYNLTINKVGQGQTTPAEGTYTYNSGTPVSVQATPSTGYEFTGWSGDASGTVNPLTITMDKNKSVTANFAIKSYSLTINKGSGSGTYKHGVVVNIQADAPEAGYHFVNWTGDVANVADVNASSTTITMLNNAVITVNYAINTYTLTINATNGSVTKKPDQTSYNYGTPVTLTAKADTGYKFTGWSGDLSGSANPATITIDANKSVAASFETILAVSVGSASGHPSDNGIAVPISVGNLGSRGVISVDLTLTYDKDLLAAVSVDKGSAVSGWSLTANTSLQGEVRIALFNTTKLSAAGGEIAKVVFNVKPTATSGSKSALALTKAKFNSDLADTITAGEFTILAPITYKLTIAKTGQGQTSPIVGEHIYNSGTPVSVQATPSTGYEFTGWSGDASGTVNPLTITMDKNKSVTANFEDIAAPVNCSITINSGAEYANSSKVTLSISAEDKELGISKMQFSNDGTDFSKSKWENYNTTKEWTLLKGEGEMTVYARFQDKAGNISEVVSDAIIVDTTKPVINLTAPEPDILTNNPTILVSGNITEDLSGINWVKVNGNNASLSGNNFTYNLGLKEGKNTIPIEAADKAGNLADAKSVTITLDSIAPLGSIVINSGQGYTKDVEVTLSLSAEDSGSGVEKMQFSNDGKDYSELQDYNKTKGWTLSAGEGKKTVYVKFQDKVGNLSGAFTSTIVLDQTPPQGSVSINDGKPYTNNPEVILNISANDNLSPITQMSITGDAGSTHKVDFATTYKWKLSAGDGEKKVYVTLIDAAGNESEPLSASIILDTLPPAEPTVTSIEPTQIVRGEYYTKVTTIKISGSKEKDSSIFINGGEKVALNTQADWSCEYTLKDDEKSIMTTNNLKITSKDAAGNESEAEELEIIVKPRSKIRIISPLKKFLRSQDLIAKTNDIAILYMVDDGTSIKARRVSLEEGKLMTFTISDEDELGNLAEEKIALMLDNTAPSISVTSPQDGSTVSSVPVVLEGRITDSGSGIKSLKVSGKTVSFSQDTFKVNLNLSEGTNTIVLEGEDKAGNIATAALALDYAKPSTPSIEEETKEETVTGTSTIFIVPTYEGKKEDKDKEKVSKPDAQAKVSIYQKPADVSQPTDTTTPYPEPEVPSVQKEDQEKLIEKEEGVSKITELPGDKKIRVTSKEEEKIEEIAEVLKVKMKKFRQFLFWKAYKLELEAGVQPKYWQLAEKQRLPFWLRLDGEKGVISGFVWGKKIVEIKLLITTQEEDLVEAVCELDIK